MPIEVTCGQCKQHHTVKDVLAGRKFTCKACGNLVAVPAPRSANADDDFLDALDEAAQVERKASRVKAKKRPQAAPPIAVGPPEVEKTELPELTWHDILAAPFDEEVIGMSVLLLINYFLWVGGALAAGVATVIVTFVFGGAGMAWVGALLSLAGIVYYLLRMYAYYLGQYFAIVERFAHGYMLSEQQEAWYTILGFALGVMVIAAFPASLSMGLASAVGNVPLLVVSCVIGYAWYGIYMPMGIAVTVLKRSLNPVLVLTWIGTCGIDYLVYFVVSSAFCAVGAGVWFLSVQIVNAIAPYLLPNLAGPFGALLDAFFYHFLVFVPTFLVGQYLIVGLCAMLGSMIRRHEADLDY